MPLPDEPSGQVGGLVALTECELCGSDAFRPFARGQGLRVMRCAACGLVSVNPRPDVNALHAEYNSGGSSRIQYYLDVEAADRRTALDVFELVHRFRPPPGRVLDIGPNIGTFLDVARTLGWETQGVELNATAATFCQSERGLDVKMGVLEDADIEHGTKHLVLMCDVLEHLPNPKRTMREVRDLISPDGLVLISTPNVETLAGRVLQMKPREHLHLFSPSTLRKLLETAGFEVAHLGPYDRYHNVTAMSHSTTLGGVFGVLGPVFRLARRTLGDVIVRLPIRENLIALARPARRA